MRETPEYELHIDTIIDCEGDQFKYTLLHDADAFGPAVEEQSFLTSAFAIDAIGMLAESQSYSSTPRQVTYTYGPQGQGWVILTPADSSEDAEAQRILGTGEFSF